MAFKVVIYAPMQEQARELAMQLKASKIGQEITFLPYAANRATDANVGIFISPLFASPDSPFIKQIGERIEEYWNKGTLCICHHWEGHADIPKLWLNNVFDIITHSFAELVEEMDQAFGRFQYG